MYIRGYVLCVIVCSGMQTQAPLRVIDMNVSTAALNKCHVHGNSSKQSDSCWTNTEWVSDGEEVICGFKLNYGQTTFR